MSLFFCLSVCSNTLWVGHLSKLVADEDLSDLFGEYGSIESIHVIAPRGCAYVHMNRRQDAYKALKELNKHKLQGKPITVGIIVSCLFTKWHIIAFFPNNFFF